MYPSYAACNKKHENIQSSPYQKRPFIHYNYVKNVIMVWLNSSFKSLNWNISIFHQMSSAGARAYTDLL